VTVAGLIRGNSKKESRPVETVLRAKLRELFGRGLFAEHGDGRIAGHKFDQQSDQRDYSPNYEYQEPDAA